MTLTKLASSADMTRFVQYSETSAPALRSWKSPENRLQHECSMTGEEEEEEEKDKYSAYVIIAVEGDRHGSCWVWISSEP